MQDLVGKHLGKYYIVDHLASGGMAEVYRGFHPRLSRYVAIKVIRRQLASHSDFVDRFEREAMAVAQFRHPNIVQVHDFDLINNMYYMVMEYVEGPTLETELLERNRQHQHFSNQEIGQILIPLASAINYAHQRGIVHRDLKPANIMFTLEGNVVLTDFGVALLRGTSEGEEAGLVTGTLAYMSPEQAQGEVVDERSDVYSLGVVLYEVLTGQVPFAGNDFVQVVMQIIGQNPPKPSTIRPGIDPNIENLILKALSKNPDTRYSSVAEMDNHFQSLTATAQSPAAIPTTPLVSVSQSAKLPNQTAIFRQMAFLPAPQSIASPPVLPNFVGRESELKQFMIGLKTNHVAVITGMAGIGKTALAAQLANQFDQPHEVFWYSCLDGDGIQSIVWQLAGFLFHQGKEDLWQLLETIRQAGGQLPPVDELFDYLFHLLNQGRYLLCFDDFQHVEDDPLMASFTDRLKSTIAENDVLVIITSRRMPTIVDTLPIKAIAGLSKADVQIFANERGLTLTDDQIDQLYTQTEGNAEFLNLAVNILQRSRNPARTLARLEETNDIEQYLMAEVDDSLDDDEREVMEAVSILMRYPGTRDAISAILGDVSVRRTLRDLVDTNLLTQRDGPSGREYSQHAIVQLFYYDSLGRRTRIELHEAAAAYYELDEPDTLKSAQHYERARHYEKSAALVTKDIWTLINQGQSKPLQRLLNQFKARDFDSEHWVQINNTQGKIHALFGERELAQKHHQIALDELSYLPDQDTQKAYEADICRDMAELLEQEAPQEALVWLERGLTIANANNAKLSAALQIKVGTVQINMGNFDLALDALKAGYRRIPETSGQLKILALRDLGVVHFFLGDLDQAIQYTRRALEISERQYDHFQTVDLLNNLSAFRFTACHWSEAIEGWQQALTLAEHLGSVIQVASAEGNLGSAHIYKGDHEQALTHLNKAFGLAKDNHLKMYETTFQYRLAELHIKQKQWNMAADAIQQAEDLANEIKAKGNLPEIYSARAELALAQGDLQQGLNYAQQAYGVSDDLQMTLEKGKSLRILAQLQQALGNHQQAQTNLAESLALLETQDRYEAALTKKVLGQYWLQDDRSTALKWLTEARETFVELGAKRDLADLHF
ncbi:MAG: protein kinase [Chloroflexota bacterium]